MSQVALKTKLSIDTGIANYLNKYVFNNTGDAIQFNYTYSDMPNAPNRFFTNFDTSSTQGGFWFFVPIMVSF